MVNQDALNICKELNKLSDGWYNAQVRTEDEGLAGARTFVECRPDAVGGCKAKPFGIDLETLKTYMKNGGLREAAEEAECIMAQKTVCKELAVFGSYVLKYLRLDCLTAWLTCFPAPSEAPGEVGTLGITCSGDGQKCRFSLGELYCIGMTRAKKAGLADTCAIAREAMSHVEKAMANSKAGDGKGHKVTQQGADEEDEEMQFADKVCETLRENSSRWYKAEAAIQEDIIGGEHLFIKCATGAMDGATPVGFSASVKELMLAANGSVREAAGMFEAKMAKCGTEGQPDEFGQRTVEWLRDDGFDAWFAYFRQAMGGRMQTVFGIVCQKDGCMKKFQLDELYEYSKKMARNSSLEHTVSEAIGHIESLMLAETDTPAEKEGGAKAHAPIHGYLALYMRFAAGSGVHYAKLETDFGAAPTDEALEDVLHGIAGLYGKECGGPVDAAFVTKEEFEAKGRIVPER